MLRPIMGGTILVVTLAATADAQSFTGTYGARNDQGGQTVVTLRQTGQQVTGTIVGNGSTFQLQGVLEDDVVVGAVTGGPAGGLWFEAELDGTDLYVTLIAAGADGQPDYEQMTTLTFARQGSAVTQGGGGNPLAGGAANPLAPAADPWVGTFSDGTITLELQGSGGRYTGTVRLGQQAFPLEVAGSAGDLTGSFRSPDGAFPVALRRGADGMVLTTGGATYTLRPAAGANPLAGGGAAQPQPAAGARAGGAGGLDDGTPIAREWSTWLAGKKATKMSSYSSGSAGGYSDRTDVHLCPDGQFTFSGSSMVAADVGDVGGYSAGSSRGGGRWRIITQGNLVGIELRYADGSVEQHRLDYQDQKTYVDGERWLITPSEVCGGGY